MKSFHVSIILTQKFDQPNYDTLSHSSSIFSHQTLNVAIVSHHCTYLRVTKIVATIGAAPIHHAHLPPLPC